MTDAFTIEKVGKFQVVRDDLYKGGTKRRAFKKLIDTIPEEELVYACDYYGHAAYAIALTAQEVNKKVTLFYLSPKKDTDIFQKTVAMPNVTYHIVEGAHTQVEASKTAQEYAKQNNALFLPIGLDFPAFESKLTEVVKEAKIDAPEIWCMGGSGTLSRALKNAYPETPVHVVSVGTANFFAGGNTVYNAPEDLDEKAHNKPPYPSSAHYDAKTWQFVEKQAKDGACIWNVA
ncbi:hypothetical protein H6758_02265 [Candidatus Nomurabacteria bacterium]|nr:hypothetical protein [Candidatus Nomurabacteria bacterium]